MKKFKQFLKENGSLTDFEKQEIENAAMNPNQNETPRERKNREAHELNAKQQKLRTTAMNPSGSLEFFDNDLHINKPTGIQTAEYEDKEEMSALDGLAVIGRGYLDAMGQVFGGITPIQKPKPKDPTPRPGPFDDDYIAPPTTGDRFGYTDKENK
jgi:hypothetical protein